MQQQLDSSLAPSPHSPSRVPPPQVEESFVEPPYEGSQERKFDTVIELRLQKLSDNVLLHKESHFTKNKNFSRKYEEAPP